MFKPFVSFRSGAGVRASLGAMLLVRFIRCIRHSSAGLRQWQEDDRSKSLRVVGLTDDGHLVCFNENTPRRLREIGYVSGLMQPDSALIGIDFRVQDGLLYGVGNGGGVYQIDTSNAVATPVNSLTMALDGASFGVDFNPAADRLRIVSDTGQNLRHNVNAGGVTLSDGALNYTCGNDDTRHRRCRLHQQRPRCDNGNHSVRHGHEPRSDSDSVTAEQWLAGRDRRTDG